MIAARRAWCRSARPVTSGSTVNRVTGGHGRDHALSKTIDADCLQPDREKRQVGAGHAEQVP